MSDSGVVTKLRRCGCHPTPQRMEVAEVLFERPQHLSADQILERLRAAGSRVSKATVYNTLRLFSQCGLVHEINVDPARKFYDSTTHPHHHFYNVDTGELTDIPANQIDVSGLPELPAGTVPQGVEVLIRVREQR